MLNLYAKEQKNQFTKLIQIASFEDDSNLSQNVRKAIEKYCELKRSEFLVYLDSEQIGFFTNFLKDDFSPLINIKCCINTKGKNQAFLPVKHFFMTKDSIESFAFIDFSFPSNELKENKFKELSFEGKTLIIREGNFSYEITNIKANKIFVVSIFEIDKTNGKTLTQVTINYEHLEFLLNQNLGYVKEVKNKKGKIVKRYFKKFNIYCKYEKGIVIPFIYFD